ncbi:hypothetical protein TIFTF001_011353 [Ficus carica]|uniref:Uncharacterized protein n=1 Tax=Ficus carica TaxID=3494 RepID=A0AA88D0M5_FICCA|nr:hypothetical protein TIFTF001_011353 [Ficus carica]
MTVLSTKVCPWNKPIRAHRSPEAPGFCHLAEEVAREPSQRHIQVLVTYMNSLQKGGKRRTDLVAKPRNEGLCSRSKTHLHHHPSGRQSESFLEARFITGKQ